MVVLGFYVAVGLFAQPSSDDYCFAYKAMRIGYIHSQLEWYNGWTGRYSSSAIITAMTYIDMPKYYWLFPLFLFALTLYSFYRYLGAMPVARLSRFDAFVYALLLLVIYIYIQKSTAETFYWLSGAYTYQTGNALVVLGVSFLFSLWNSDKKTILYSILAGLCLFIASGTNELSMVLSLFVSVVALFLAFKYDKTIKRYVFPLMASFLGGALIIGSPGNAIRSTLQRYPDAHNLALTLTKSSHDYFSYLLEKISSIPFMSLTMLSLAISLPIFRALYVNMAGGRAVIIMVSTFYLGVLFLLFVPSYWATGVPSPPRAMSVIDTWFLLGWFIFVPSILCLFPKIDIGSHARWVGVSLASLFVISIWLSDSMVKMGDIKTAYAYNQELQDRYNLINETKRTGNTDMIVSHLENIPRIIFFEDIRTNEKAGPNACYASYFGISSIKID